MLVIFNWYFLQIYYSGCAFNFGLKDVAFNAMGSVDNTEEVQYLYRFQNSNHFKRLKDFSLQNCMAPAKIEIRTQVDDGIWVVLIDVMSNIKYF